MDPLHARYPFLSAARAAVEDAEVDLAELVARESSPVVDRAIERVEAALTEGTVGTQHRQPRVELLSYPVARVLVSLVDEPVLTRTYARAEATVAHERFVEDCTTESQLKSTRNASLDRERLLAEFDLDGDVRPLADGEGYSVAVGAYLELAAGLDGDDWRLVNRALADGWVPVSEEELYALLRQAVEERVAAGLPFAVPDAIADPLDHAVVAIEDRLADLDLATDIDAVVPGLFPPCMRALLTSARGDEDLPHHSRFALTTFLAAIGMSPDEAVALLDADGETEEVLRYQHAHVAREGGPAEYSPPSCATMDAYGDCVNKDERCETIPHPLAYYEDALDDAEGYTDWREV